MQRTAWLRSITVLLAVTITWLFQGCASQHHSVPPKETEVPYSFQEGSPIDSNNDKSNEKQTEKTVTSSPKNQSSNSEDSTYTAQPFDCTHPQLKGIALATTLEEVQRLWGEPEEHYVMDDADPLDVYEYKDFSFGYKQDGSIMFIEVSGQNSSTGIKGLDIGDNEDVASRVLGRPDHDTPWC